MSPSPFRSRAADYLRTLCPNVRVAFSAAASARCAAASTRLAAASARRAASSARAAACSARVAVAVSSLCAHPAPMTVISIKLATPAPIERKRIPLTSIFLPPSGVARKITTLLSQKARPRNGLADPRLVVVVHVLAGGSRRRALPFLGLVRDRCLRREEQSRNARGVL